MLKVALPSDSHGVTLEQSRRSECNNSVLYPESDTYQIFIQVRLK